jgi:choline dehydrogenase-like flavoprotein
MGEDGAHCATDSFGKVRGADGLYVNDASLLPGPTVVNPQGTVMAIAHRNALRFLDARG